MTLVFPFPFTVPILVKMGRTPPHRALSLQPIAVTLNFRSYATLCQHMRSSGAEPAERLRQVIVIPPNGKTQPFYTPGLTTPSPLQLHVLLEGDMSRTPRLGDGGLGFRAVMTLTYEALEERQLPPLIRGTSFLGELLF